MAAVLGLGALVAPTAHAHINMTGALLQRNGDQKMYPCDGKRGDGPVYTFEPGATITLAVDEYIPHPSYYRIAFDNDGNDFAEPLSIDPPDDKRTADGKCMKDKLDHCGAADFCSFVSDDGPTVLWDNLDPHPAKFGAKWSWNVELPDMECDNCTIQVIQVMEDSNAHGPYCVHGNDCTGDTSAPDIYHRCIDIKLVKGAKNGDGATTDPVKNNGMQCTAKGAPSEPTEPTSDAGVSEAPDAPVASTDGGVSSRRDAGAASADDDNTSGSTGKNDAGKTAKPDAGKTTDTSDEPDSDDDGGCSLAAGHDASSSSALGLLFALGACLVQRRSAAQSR